MSYEHDVFISYKRGDQSTDWVRKTVVPLLRSFLAGNIAGDRHLFIDEHLNEGVIWPNALHRKVSRSRILVAFTSIEYFQSKWCRKEMALMLEREESEDRRGKDQDYGFVIPVQIMDGQRFPALAKRIHHRPLNHLFLRGYNKESQAYDELVNEMRSLTDVICATLEKAPQWDAKWHRFTGGKFMRKILARRADQKGKPGFVF